MAFLAAAVALSLGQLDTFGGSRGPYGVPLVTGQNPRQAFYGMGFMVAEDRLWQMEMSRRVSRGRLAEIMGPSGVNSDKEVLKYFYTDAELQAMLDSVPKTVKDAFQAYSDGVNNQITRRKAQGKLPKGYAELGFEPEPWTPLDSVAISIRLVRQFGTGGAGELRNTAQLMYLDTQKGKDRKLDVMDDLAWQNDPDSIPTVSPDDDPLRDSHPKFPEVTRATTEAHLASLPKPSLFELIPAIRMMEETETDLVAQNLATPFKMGSYAVVVGPDRSRTGHPMLLSAPQMGHSTPSVVHEISVRCPEFSVTGIDVPGIPAVVIGATATFAWGLTSGVADVEDIFVTPLDQAKIETETFTRKLKGGEDFTVVRERTPLGFVALKSAGAKAVYSRHSTLLDNELKGVAAIMDVYGAQTPDDLDKAMAANPASFNFFYAFSDGSIGYRYCGHVPMRAEGLDPRLPTPDKPEYQWKGIIPSEQMPHVRNPKSGLLANWNNKPTAWWPNMDTPVWGSVFRNEVLLDSIPAGKLGIRDVQMAAWSIARKETHSNGVFLPYFRDAIGKPQSEAQLQLSAWDGWDVANAPAGGMYDESVKALRTSLFQPWIGNLLDPSLFEQAIQPSVLVKALNGRTKFDWLGGKSKEDHLKEAVANAEKKLISSSGMETNLWRFMPGQIQIPGQAPIPYADRGTYIQIIELNPTQNMGLNVVSPGNAEEGDNAFDQVPLARAWTYKIMVLPTRREFK